MAKGKSRTRGGRDAPVIATTHRVVLRPIQLIGPRPMSQYEDNLANAAWDDYDRRRFRPDKSVRPPTSVKGAARIKQGKHPSVLGFAEPHRMMLCARRRIRERIMHAAGLAGRRKRKFRKPRLNFWSRISCK